MTRGIWRVGVALAVGLAIAGGGCAKKKEAKHGEGEQAAATGTASAGPDGGRGTDAGARGTSGGLAHGATGHAGGTGAAGGADPGGSMTPAQQRAAAAMAAAKPAAFTAAGGGMYRSADGTLVVQIPPGALTGDGVLRFARVDTSNYPVAKHGTPGILILGEWGNNQIRAGASVMVKALVDARFVEALRALDPKKDPADIGLSQDSQGRWYLSIMLEQDKLGRPESVSQATYGTGKLLEVGRLPYLKPPVSDKMLEEAEPDGVGVVGKSEDTLAPLPAADPLVNRYPAMPKAKSTEEKYHPVELVTDKQDNDTLPVATTIGESLAGVESMLMCEVSPCDSPAVATVRDAIRFNDAVRAHRLPPDALTERVHKACELGCLGLVSAAATPKPTTSADPKSRFIKAKDK